MIGELLVNPEFVVYEAKGKGKGDDTGGKPFEKPLQMVCGTSAAPHVVIVAPGSALASIS